MASDRSAGSMQVSLRGKTRFNPGLGHTKVFFIKEVVPRSGLYQYNGQNLTAYLALTGGLSEVAL